MGKGAAGDQDSVVDLFQRPGGVGARAIAAAAKQNLAAAREQTMTIHRYLMKALSR
jgi:hypothetical protein